MSLLLENPRCLRLHTQAPNASALLFQLKAILGYQMTQRGGAPHTRSTSSQPGRQASQRGTTRKGGYSAYAGYPHQQFAADHAAEAAKTRAVPAVHK